MPPTTPVLTDTHCHLNLKQFDADRPAVLERAARSGVERILVPGLDLSTSESAILLGECNQGVYSAVGIHPSEAKSVDQDSLLKLRHLARHSNVKAIGEIGLDYYHHSEAQNRQVSLLQSQLDLAGEMKLPVLLHFREKGDAIGGPCADTMLKILEAWSSGITKPGTGMKRVGVLHSFSGTHEMARSAIAMGFFIGISGSVTHPAKKNLQEVVSLLPLENLLLETDSPFQTPLPKQGSRNEPSNIGLIADKIASLHSCSPLQVARVTSGNASRLFNWN